MAHDVFISYSSKDKPVADAACATLEAKGIRCWIAPRDIVPGADWGGAIIDGIDGARAFLLIISGHANASQQIKREVERAVHNNLPIIPMRIEKVELTKNLTYFVNSQHWLDAMTPPLERHLAYLAEVMRHILDGAALPKPPAPAAPKIPPFLQDRRVLIGGGAALIAVAGLSTWFSIASTKPPTFVGKWKAEKVTLSRPAVGGSLSFATDIFVDAAAAGGSIGGSFEVDELGSYRYYASAEDTGTVSVSDKEITFTSDATKKAVTMGYMRFPGGQAYGGAPGDLVFLLDPSAMGYGQVALMGKPLTSRGTPLENVVAGWKTGRQINPMVRTPLAALTISEDGRYKFHGELDERGLWSAADGKWTRTPDGPGGQFAAVSGTYAFDGRDRVTCAATNGSTVWVRVE